jgi:hypothetical protein
MRLGLRANIGQIKTPRIDDFGRADCVILECRSAEIRSNSLNLEQLASGDLTDARNVILGCFGRSHRRAQRSGPSARKVDGGTAQTIPELPPGFLRPRDRRKT